jgi:predicted alpha/beta-hydrolase family hydrolase
MDGKTLQESPESYRLEQAKIKLVRGGEISIVYGVPSKIHDPSTCLIIAHGAGGPMHTPSIRYFHTELAKRGFLTVKFNFPYMEAHRRVPDRREILEESYRTIVDQAKNSKTKPNRMFIGGKSMGGRIASQIAANGVDVNGLFFLGYPLHPIGKTDQLRDEHLYRIKKPMLFVSGTRDSFARKDLLEKVVSKIGPNAQIHWIQNGDHSFKTPDAKKGSEDTLQEALASLLDWLQTIP